MKQNGNALKTRNDAPERLLRFGSRQCTDIIHQENYTLLNQLVQMYCSLTRDPLGIFHIFFV
jgi:hypothetical protein